MPNNVNGIFETLVVPASIASAQAAEFNNPMLEYVFNGYTGSTGTIGNTMNVNVPIVNEADVSNITNGPIAITDTNHTPTSITISTNMSDAKRIQSFDQIRTPMDLQMLYLQAMMESVLRKINRSIAALVNPSAGTGFLSVNASQAGTLADEISRQDVATAWGTLVGAGAPMRPQDCFFVTHHVPYAKAMADVANSWIQQYVVGEAAATAVQQTARFMPQYQMTLNYDQTMPKVGTKYATLCFHRFAIGLLPVNQPAADTGGYVRELTVFPRSTLPFRVQFYYDPGQQGYVIHVNSVYGLGIVRPEWGIQIVHL